MTATTAAAAMTPVALPPPDVPAVSPAAAVADGEVSMLGVALASGAVGAALDAG